MTCRAAPTLIATCFVLALLAGCADADHPATIEPAAASRDPSPSVVATPTAAPTPTPAAAVPSPSASPSTASPHATEPMNLWVGGNGWAVSYPSAWEPTAASSMTESWVLQSPMHQLMVGKTPLDAGTTLAGYDDYIRSDFEARSGGYEPAMTEPVTIDGAPGNLHTYRLDEGFLALLAIRVHDPTGSYLLLRAHAGDDPGHRALFDRIVASFHEMSGFDSAYGEDSWAWSAMCLVILPLTADIGDILARTLDAHASGDAAQVRASVQSLRASTAMIRLPLELPTWEDIDGGPEVQAAYLAYVDDVDTLAGLFLQPELPDEAVGVANEVRADLNRIVAALEGAGLGPDRLACP